MKFIKLLTVVAFAVCATVASAEVKEIKKGSCCDKAKAAGKECTHPCCVEAKKEGKTCEKCGMDNNGCCKDEVRVVKIQDNQESSAGFTAVPKIEATPVARPIEGSSGSYTKGSSIMQFAHAPPPGYGHGFQAFYCVFRI